MGPLAEPASGKLLDGLTSLTRARNGPRNRCASTRKGRYWSRRAQGIKPGDPYLTEYFGPITGIMYAPDLATAIAYQNAPLSV